MKIVNERMKIVNESDGCLFFDEQCCVHIYKFNGQLSVGEKVPLYADKVSL